VASLSVRDLSDVRLVLVFLGLLFAAVNLIATRHGASPGGRFSPVASLDPISASLVSVIACLAALTYRFASLRATFLQTCVCLTLAVSAMLNGGRGPVVALIVATAGLLAFKRRPATILVVAALAVGLAVGHAVRTPLIGEHSNRSQASSRSQPISSLSIRREWLSSALRKFPDKPALGHGVGMLVDNTPEAAVMGVKGQLVYPHNDAVESLYSLGIVGGVLFALLVGLPVVAWWQNRARLSQSLPLFALLLFVFAFAECNFSGEIGTDQILWSVAAFAVLGASTAGHRTPR
jgi:O-antigen ligase